MRNRFNGPRRGRRVDRPGSAPTPGSPYDFGSADDAGVEPIDMMAIRADEELLDALAAGDASFGAFGRLGAHAGPADGYNDDQQLLALLATWRDEVREEPISELLTVEEASEAIVAGHRAARPQRRLMPVAAAAAAVVLAGSALAIGTSAAQPGDALWGVSKAVNGDRAASMEAAQRVSIALASVQQALDEGRVKDARATLASVTPDLSKITDDQTKKDLVTKQSNLVDTVDDAHEGEKVHTDETGKRDDDGDTDNHGGYGKGNNPWKSSDARFGSPKGSEKGQDGAGSSGSAPSGTTTEPDTRRELAPTTHRPPPGTETGPTQTTEKPPPPKTDTTRPPWTRPETSKEEPSKEEPPKGQQPPKDDSTKTQDGSKPDSNKTQEGPKGQGDGGSSGGTAMPAQPGPQGQQGAQGQPGQPQSGP